MMKLLAAIVLSAALAGVCLSAGDSAPEKSGAPAVPRMSAPPFPEPAPGTDTKPPGGKGRRGPGRGGPFGHFRERLTAGEQAELQRLAAAKDRDGLRKKFNELRKKYASPEDRKIEALSAEYLSAKTPEEQASVRKELKEAVRARFTKRLEFTQRQIADAENKLKHLKAFHQRNIMNSEKIIEDITSFMCLSPEQREKIMKQHPRGNASRKIPGDGARNNTASPPPQPQPPPPPPMD